MKAGKHSRKSTTGAPVASIGGGFGSMHGIISEALKLQNNESDAKQSIRVSRHGNPLEDAAALQRALRVKFALDVGLCAFKGKQL